jgi:hypothetical protein
MTANSAEEDRPALAEEQILDAFGVERAGDRF